MTRHLWKGRGKDDSKNIFEAIITIGRPDTVA